MPSLEAYLEITDVFMLAIVGFIYILICINVYRAYKRRPMREAIILTVFFLFAAGGIIGLMFQRYYLSFFYINPWLLDPVAESQARIWTVIATTLAVIALITLNAFTLTMTFSERMKTLLPIIAVCGAIPAGLIDYVSITGIARIIDKGFENPDYITIAAACLLLPIIFLPPIIFFYYSAKVSKESPPHYKRSLTISIALTLLALTYFMETIGGRGILAIIIRFGFLVSAIILYIPFWMPEWYKKRIGWT